jgi:hypothetical protein
MAIIYHMYACTRSRFGSHAARAYLRTHSVAHMHGSTTAYAAFGLAALGAGTGSVLQNTAKTTAATR